MVAWVRARAVPGPAAAVATLLALLVLAPVLWLLGYAFAGSGWASLLRPGMLERSVVTLLFGLGTTVLAICWGLSTAWLVEMCSFTGRRFYAFALFLPFAVPPYLAAYLWADLVEQSDYLPAAWSLRNLPGACLVMSLVLYPYVYMLARASFAQRSGGLLAAAFVLGCNSWGAFWRVALPLTRPALAIGAIMVFMEVINDIAVARDYGLRTLGLHVYDVWLNRGDRPAAAAAAGLLVLLAVILAMAESASRRSQRQYVQTVKHYRLGSGYQLYGWLALLAQGWCMVILGFALIIPIGWLTVRLIDSDLRGLASLPDAFLDTLGVVLPAVLLAFAISAALAWCSRADRSKLASALAQIARSGYAFPGSVYALGALVFVGALSSATKTMFGFALVWLWAVVPGLLIYALAARYLIAAGGSLDAGLAHLPPNLIAVARCAGLGAVRRAVQVHVPMLRPALIAGALLIGVDLLKELPLSLILRPLGMSTLAVEIFQHASDEDLGRAAPAAWLIVLLAAMMLALAYRWIVPTWRRSASRWPG